MGVYVTRKCPQCKRAIESMVRDYVAIGPPFVECPSCRATIMLDHVNEWDMKDFGSKAYFIFVHSYTCLFWSFGMTILPCFLILIPAIKVRLKHVPNGTLWLCVGAWACISAIAVSTFYTKSLLREIRESKQRMKDPAYADRLNRVLEGLF